MIQPSLATALLSLALLLAPAPATAGAHRAGADLEALVAAEAASAETREDLWTRALELRDAEGFVGSGELDRILDRYLGKAGELSPQAVLLFSACRIQGEDPDAALLSAALSPILDAPDQELGTAAAGLLGDSIFKGLRSGAKDELVEALLERAADASRSPTMRLRLAHSAHVLGTGRQARTARGEIAAFLDSEDPELRAHGALTLAALRGEPIEGQLRMELERLARVPDQEGELAAAFLKRADMRELHDRALKDLRAKYRDEQGKVPSELAELLAVKRRIEVSHLEGASVDEEELMQAAMNGMLHWMDQHSSYLSPEAYAKFFQELEANYGGIGAYVGEDRDDGLFTIIRPIYSGPSYEAGLMSDDKIVRIGDWPTIGKDVDEIIRRLKGKPGTKVKLYVWRRGMDPDQIERPTEEMAMWVERRQIQIPASAYQLLPAGIGLVELTTFSKPAQEQLLRAIAKMSRDGMRALVLDLRANQGGLLNQAREVADLFLGKRKVIVSTESRGRDEPTRIMTHGDAVLPEDLPVVILTGRFTASAAEIVAGALKDHGRAVLVGNRTFGKGSVQQLIPVQWEGAQIDDWDDVNGNGMWDTWEPLTVDHDGDGEMDYPPHVKLTVARYLLPSGRSIHRVINRDGEIIQEGGVAPDHEIGPGLIERWRFLEQRRLANAPELRDYVDAHWREQHDLFQQLALNDRKDTSVYPDFDELVTKLDTSLPRDDVRRLLRNSIRRRLQDERGAKFPDADFVEDVQLQKAIEVALEQLGETYRDFDDFGLVFDYEAAETGSEGELASALRPVPSERLSRARALILEARDGGLVLSREELDEVLGVLDGEIQGSDD
jgi:C-terminal peptidase prc